MASTGPVPADLRDAPHRRCVARDGSATLDAEPGAARHVVGWVTHELTRAGWTRAHRADVALAVDEAVQNAVEHGSLPGASIEVRVRVGAEVTRVTVRDGGRPDQPTPTGAATAPDPHAIRGRGRVIMASLCDDVWCHPRGEGTEVVLVFRRRRDGGDVTRSG